MNGDWFYAAKYSAFVDGEKVNIKHLHKKILER